MKICICVFGETYDKKCFLEWIKHYQSNIPPILIYDSSTCKEVLELWPYEKHKINTQLFVKSNQKELYWTEKFQLYTYADIMKFLCYKEIGECLVVDYDTVFRKNITENMIPECKLGIVPFSKYSNFFNPARLPCKLIYFDEYDYVPWLNVGVQIIKEDYVNLLIELIKKYLNRLQYNIYVETYIQNIISLLHRCVNGVYLAPEWNWYPLTKIENNSVIIEHFYGNESKELMEQLI